MNSCIPETLLLYFVIPSTRVWLILQFQIWVSLCLLPLDTSMVSISLLLLKPSSRLFLLKLNCHSSVLNTGWCPAAVGDSALFCNQLVLSICRWTIAAEAQFLVIRAGVLLGFAWRSCYVSANKTCMISLLLQYYNNYQWIQIVPSMLNLNSSLLLRCCWSHLYGLWWSNYEPSRSDLSQIIRPEVKYFVHTTFNFILHHELLQTSFSTQEYFCDKLCQALNNKCVYFCAPRLLKFSCLFNLTCAMTYFNNLYFCASSCFLLNWVIPGY